MPFLLEPDDDIRFFQSDWLGPAPWTLPWKARYLAYVVFLTLGAALGAFYWATPLELGDPVTEVALLALATTAVMLSVDHNKPIGALLLNVAKAVRYRRSPAPRTYTATPRLYSNMKWSRDT